MKLKNLGEFSLIEKISKNFKPSMKVIKGIGDDTAVLEYKKDKFLLVTCDMLLEDRHFHRKTPAYLVGKKSLSVSISDIASMGGAPNFFLVSLGVPGSLDVKYVNDLYKGLKDTARKFKIDLIGGDTVNSKKIIIDITLLGEVEKKNLVLRSSAKNKDAIFVTGAIGGSLKRRHLNFTPRLKEARFLVNHFKVNSMIDVSDGLIQDLAHILKSSGKGAIIHEKNIPISKDAKSFDKAIKDGEDFELIFTMSKANSNKLMKIWPFKTRLSKIGEITSGQNIKLVRKNGKEEILEPKGYRHF